MSDDAELLAELATLDEVEAVIPTSLDHSQEAVPSWCELILNVNRTDDGSLDQPMPFNTRMFLRRHDGELMMQVLWDVLHPEHPIPSVERMYMQLDRVVDKIQKRANKGKSPLPVHIGEARGLATAIAMITNPMAPDVDEVKAVAMERYEARAG